VLLRSRVTQSFHFTVESGHKKVIVQLPDPRTKLTAKTSTGVFTEQDQIIQAFSHGKFENLLAAISFTEDITLPHQCTIHIHFDWSIGDEGETERSLSCAGIYSPDIAVGTKRSRGEQTLQVCMVAVIFSPVDTSFYKRSPRILASLV
jgi:hypothetical protein